MKTVASGLNVLWYVFCGLVLGVIGAGFVLGLLAVATGWPEGHPVYVSVAGLIVGGVTLAGLYEGINAFKARPRGLGQRRVRKWKDGTSYYEWEKH